MLALRYANRAARQRAVLPSSLVILGICLCGCNQGFYKAASLPRELEAPIVRSARQVDLASLSGPAVDGELIQPGDLLKVSITTGLEQNFEELPFWLLRVSPNGTVDVPLIGQISVAGFTPASADAAIRDAGIQRGLYRNPQVAVRFEERRTNKVKVAGAVVEPGVVELPRAGSDVAAAIIAAGDLTDDADTWVEIRRPASFDAGSVQQVGYRPGGAPQAPPASQVDLLNPAASRPQDLRVDDGAVLMVRKKPVRTFFVTGLVNEGGQFEMPIDRDMRLLDGISMAKGRRIEIADKVHVVRTDPNTKQSVTIVASYREAKRNNDANIRLAAGDVISVEETPVTFTVDMLQSFIRFGFTAGLPGT